MRSRLAATQELHSTSLLPRQRRKRCGARSVSRETEARLDRYVALLEWQAKTNLIAPSTFQNIWTRHIADSLQLLALAPGAQSLGRFRQRRRVSRAGARLRDRGDTARSVHLVERNAKKAAFLREAVRVTGAAGDGVPD